MSIQIATTDYFDKYFKWFGYEEFTKKVLLRCPNKKEYGLVGEITLFDAEPSKRIFLKNEFGQEFTIRYFIECQDDKTWKASYIFFIDVKDEDGGGHGEKISEGIAITHYQN